MLARDVVLHGGRGAVRGLLGWPVWLGRCVMVQSREAWPCL